MENVAKPKLVFFQYGRDQNLVDFMKLHRHHHVKCLSEFFDVVVIHEDCDYQQICDKYQPDLTLFEMLSGVEQRTCQKLKITNANTNLEVPKIAFHNADSWCESRAGFLSDMEHWGIETVFSICTTAAEHTPAIAENLFVWPNFIDADTYRDYGESKIVPVLFTGAKYELYPWRQKIYKLVSEYYPSLICPHRGYSDRSAAWQVMHGEQYARTINASWFVPTCGTVAKEIVRKHFEIPGSKSCLITEKSPALEAAGFVDMENCIFVDEHDVLDKLDYLFQHLDELESITNAGYQLIHSCHTLKQRDQIFQWFNLHKNLRSNQNIVQTNPFEPLTIVEKTSGIKNSHLTCDGLHIILLRQGDEKLWAGKYDEAEALYLKCLNYIHWMPETKFRLAICFLYKGNAKEALNWIIGLIQYNFEVYKAPDPDPVEWAYFIIALLCQGRLVEATVRINQFPSLWHSELDRTRWVINCLQNQGENLSQPDNQLSKPRYSVHQLPRRNFTDWINNLCTLLQACQQFTLAEMVINSTSSHPQQQEKKTKNIGIVSTRYISSIRLNYLKTLNHFLRKLHIFNLRSNSLPILELEYILIPARLAKAKFKYILKYLKGVYYILKGFAWKRLHHLRSQNLFNQQKN